ncbi:MAG: hypothetical protein WA705_12240 [Candidatus Ozemobacteraceae bacterium]
MNSRRRTLNVGKCFVFAALFCVSASAWALPTILNYCPSVDLIPEHNLMLQLSYYNYHFTDDASKAAIKKNSSLIYSVGYGFKKSEIGVDIVGEKSFVNTDSGLYAGPVAFNFKYRLLTQGNKGDKFSLVVGAFNLGTQKYSNTDYYVPSPYFMVCKDFKDFRLHAGYQWNFLGVERLDTDRKKNNDLMLGFDAVIIKDKNHPVSLLVDYFGGPGKTLGVGLWHTLSKTISWGVSTYHPLNSELPISKFQLPKQYWVGVSYYLPL